MSCPTIHADAQAWASDNPQIVGWSEKADNLVVLGCPATNKTISETTRYIEKNSEYRGSIYLGGCLARRFDIAFPQEIKRLDHIYDHMKTISSNKTSYYTIDSFPCSYASTNKIHHSLYPFGLCHMIRGGWYRPQSFCSRLGEVRPMPWYRTDEASLAGLYLDYTAHKDNSSLLIVSDGFGYEQMIWWLETIIKFPPYFGVSFYNISVEALKGRVAELLSTACLRRHIKKVHVPLYGLKASTLKVFGRSVSKTHTALPLLEKVRSYGTEVFTDSYGGNELAKYVDFSSTIGEIEMSKQKLTNYMEL
jgi:hypothetical protein